MKAFGVTCLTMEVISRGRELSSPAKLPGTCEERDALAGRPARGGKQHAFFCSDQAASDQPAPRRDRVVYAAPRLSMLCSFQ